MENGKWKIRDIETQVGLQTTFFDGACAYKGETRSRGHGNFETMAEATKVV